MAVKCISPVFTGHMVDLPGRSKARFPAALVDAARKAIEACVDCQTRGREKNDVTGYASLARGGDILFHEICRERDSNSEEMENACECGHSPCDES